VGIKEVNPHVILEGPDCSGKTTIARFLESEHGYRYHHEGVPASADGDDLLRYYTDVLLAQKHSTVFDRFIFGETVYGPILRGEAKITPEHLRLFERVRRARNVISVVCLPSLENVVLPRWRERLDRELIKDEGTMRRVYAAYHNRVDEFDHLLSILRIPRWMLAPRRQLPEGWIGEPSARYLIVGEQVNGLPDLPFFETTGSAGYLNSCLRAAGFRETQLAFTNAYTATGKPRKLTRYPVVIALGEAASLVLASQEIEHEKIPHPAYWKRFHYHERDTYVNYLRRLR
jgi:thymidylate kinase